MRIREAEASDLDTVSAMRLAFVAEYRQVEARTLTSEFADRTRNFLRRRQEAGTIRSWLAEDDSGDCVGIVSMLLLDMPPRPDDARSMEGYVINMYVDPAARRRGIGRALFDALLTDARGLGLRRLFLHATDDGRPMYVEGGFRANDDWMELRLPGPR